MKVTLAALLVLMVALATAEPPRFGRRQRTFFPVPARQETAPPPANGGDAPYPPSGWKPDKPFYLPGEEGDGGEEEATEAPAEPESTTPSEAEETTTAAPAEEEGQQGNQSARNVAPVFVILPERNVQPAPAAAYQVLSPGPYAGSYVLQDVVLDPVTSQYYFFGNSQRLVQILKK